MPFITSDFSKAQHNWSDDEISYFREKMEEIGSYSRIELTKKTSCQIYYGILQLLDNLPIHALPSIEHPFSLMFTIILRKKGLL